MVVRKFTCAILERGCPTNLRKILSCRLVRVSPRLVQEWLYRLKNKKTKKATSARTKENMLRQISSLFAFARRMKYVTTELATEISEIPTPKQKPSPILCYTPNEITAMLAEADKQIVPRWPSRLSRVCAFPKWHGWTGRKSDSRSASLQ